MNNFDRNLEFMDGLETDFLRILYYDFNKKYNDIYKTYEYSRLCTVISGEKNIKVGKNIYKYDKEQIMILPSYSRVEMKIDKPTKAIVIELNDRLIDEIKEKICWELQINNIDNNESLLFKRENLAINDSLNKILDLALSENKDKRFLIDLYSQEMVYKMLHMKGINNILQREANNPINKSIEIMKNNILEKITISDIASDLNMSVSNFSFKFKNIVGITPNNYLRNLKLTEAEKLIKRKSVTQVASDLGYDNISHFINLFKKNYGLTPKQYLLKNRNN